MIDLLFVFLLKTILEFIQEKKPTEKSDASLMILSLFTMKIWKPKRECPLRLNNCEI